LLLVYVKLGSVPFTVAVAVPVAVPVRTLHFYVYSHSRRHNSVRMCSKVAEILLCYEVRVLKRPTSACIVCLVFAVDCGAGTVGTRPCSACP
jgi:hypothetical protein